MCLQDVIVLRHEQAGSPAGQYGLKH